MEGIRVERMDGVKCPRRRAGLRFGEAVKPFAPRVINNVVIIQREDDLEFNVQLLNERMQRGCLRTVAKNSIDYPGINSFDDFLPRRLDDLAIA